DNLSFGGKIFSFRIISLGCNFALFLSLEPPNNCRRNVVFILCVYILGNSFGWAYDLPSSLCENCWSAKKMACYSCTSSRGLHLFLHVWICFNPVYGVLLSENYSILELVLPRKFKFLR